MRNEHDNPRAEPERISADGKTQHDTNGKANGHGALDDPFAGAFGDTGRDADESWRGDLPTEDEVRTKATAIYTARSLRALGRLRSSDLEEYLDLARQLIDAAADPDVTRTKVDAAVRAEARKQQQELKAAAAADGGEDGLAVQVLCWLEGQIDRLFVDTYRRPFIDYRDPTTGIFNCRPVEHDDVADLIISCPTLKIAPPPEVVSAVVRTLATRARRSGKKVQVFVRRGWHDGALYIDRAAPDGSVIRVDASGVTLITLADCPIRFQHDVAMAELPIPVLGTSIDRLWDYIRVPRKQDRDLIAGFLIGCYAPCGPYAGLAVYGLHGSSKTTTMEMIAALVDPSLVSAGRMSDSEENTMIQVQRVALLCFDNLTELTENQSSTLCRIVQGNGFRTRLLYTNTGEAVLQAELPAVVNGITQFITRPDLVDRFMSVTLERIPPADRKQRQGIRDAFEATRPELLGAVLLAISSGLSRTDFVEPTNLPRMADHVAWVSRCERGLGMQDGDYVRSFEAGAQTGAADAVESSYLGAAIVRMQEKRDGEEWNGTPEATLERINEEVRETVRRQPEWPRNAVWLVRRLRPLVPALEAIGIEVLLDQRGSDKSRALFIRGPGPQASTTSPTSQAAVTAPALASTEAVVAPATHETPAIPQAAAARETELSGEPQPPPQEPPDQKVRRVF